MKSIGYSSSKDSSLRGVLPMISGGDNPSLELELDMPWIEHSISPSIPERWNWSALSADKQRSQSSTGLYAEHARESAQISGKHTAVFQVEGRRIVRESRNTNSSHTHPVISSNDRPQVVPAPSNTRSVPSSIKASLKNLHTTKLSAKKVQSKQRLDESGPKNPEQVIPVPAHVSTPRSDTLHPISTIGSPTAAPSSSEPALSPPDRNSTSDTPVIAQLIERFRMQPPSDPSQRLPSSQLSPLWWFKGRPQARFSYSQYAKLATLDPDVVSLDEKARHALDSLNNSVVVSTKENIAPAGSASLVLPAAPMESLDKQSRLMDESAALLQSWRDARNFANDASSKTSDTELNRSVENPLFADSELIARLKRRLGINSSAVQEKLPEQSPLSQKSESLLKSSSSGDVSNTIPPTGPKQNSSNVHDLDTIPVRLTVSATGDAQPVAPNVLSTVNTPTTEPIRPLHRTTFSYVKVRDHLESSDAKQHVGANPPVASSVQTAVDKVSSPSTTAETYTTGFAQEHPPAAMPPLHPNTLSSILHPNSDEATPFHRSDVRENSLLIESTAPSAARILLNDPVNITYPQMSLRREIMNSKNSSPTEAARSAKRPRSSSNQTSSFVETSQMALEKPNVPISRTSDQELTAAFNRSVSQLMLSHDNVQAKVGLRCKVTVSDGVSVAAADPLKTSEEVIEIKRPLSSCSAFGLQESHVNLAPDAMASFRFSAACLSASKSSPVYNPDVTKVSSDTGIGTDVPAPKSVTESVIAASALRASSFNGVLHEQNLSGYLCCCSTCTEKRSSLHEPLDVKDAAAANVSMPQVTQQVLPNPEEPEMLEVKVSNQTSSSPPRKGRRKKRKNPRRKHGSSPSKEQDAAVKIERRSSGLNSVARNGTRLDVGRDVKLNEELERVLRDAEVEFLQMTVALEGKADVLTCRTTDFKSVIAESALSSPRPSTPISLLPSKASAGNSLSSVWESPSMIPLLEQLRNVKQEMRQLVGPANRPKNIISSMLQQ